MRIELDDVCYNKAAIIERCLVRVFEEAAYDPDLQNWTHIDALVLNLERACQATIDMAMHLVSRERFGMPQTSADAFFLLQNAGYIATSLARNLAAMVGFRNVVVHAYQSINLDVLRSVIQSGWTVFVEFCTALGLRIEVKRG